MNLEEAIKIITNPLYFSNKVEEACQVILDEARRIASPINVERGDFMSSLGFGIVYNRERKSIKIDPIPFAYTLRDHHKDTGIPYEKLLWESIEHEKGHFELQRLGVEPSLPQNNLYMTLYARFEDYAISTFLKNDTYRQIEKEGFKSEAKREINTFNDICVSSLGIALGYIRLEDLKLRDKRDLVIKHIKFISGKMKKIKNPKDIQKITWKVFLKAKSENWGEIL